MKRRRAETADQLLRGKATEAVLLLRLGLSDRDRRGRLLRPGGAAREKSHERKGDEAAHELTMPRHARRGNVAAR